MNYNVNNYNSYSGNSSTGSLVASAMKRVYAKMALGLLVTAIVSFFCAVSEPFLTFCQLHRGFMWGMFALEFVIVIAISAGINKMPSATATLLFYIFSLVNGITLAPIFWVYTHVAIAKTFLITAGTFGAMSIFGYTTKQDLSKIGNILVMALIGLIIACLVNIFTQSSTLGWIISFVGVIIFVGLTAWDTQKIKQMAEYLPADQVGRLSTIGALSLYLDFINLFLFLLRFFGGSRD